MPDLKREGLIEALLDFGIDMGWTGLELGLAAFPVLNLQDLTFNYEPALRCKALFNCDLAAAGAGRFNGFSLKARPEGFWCISLTSFVTLNARVNVTVETTPPAWVPNGGLAFNFVGSSPGECSTGLAIQNFFAAAIQGDVGGVAPTIGAILQNAPALPFLGCPLWVPGNAYLNVQGFVANAAFTVSGAIIMPSQNPGRFP